MSGPRDTSAIDAPFFAQWESADLIPDILSGAKTAAEDPLWRRSGATSLEEYARWAGHLCGMACFKMAIAALRGRDEPLLLLARGAKTFGAYVEDGRDVRGLIYAPALTFLAQKYDLRGEVRTNVKAEDLAYVMESAAFFMASVHHFIRWPDREPPYRGGHLVLVTSARNDSITFHNPSGDRKETRENVTLTVKTFDRFFAGRGVAIFPPPMSGQRG